MVNALDSSAVDREFEPPRSGQTKDFNIGICCFPANRAALRRNNKDLLARNLENASEWMRHVYLRFVVSVRLYNKDPLKKSGSHHHNFIET